MLYCAMSRGKFFGWGTCASNLLAELGKLTKVQDLNGNPKLWDRVPGPVLHTIKNHDFETEIPCRGEQNIGYGFWEYSVSQAGIERSNRFDLIFAGSTWGKEHLAEFGIESKVLIQGVDRDIWNPVKARGVSNEFFVVASVGKFELRKGQDIAMAAMKVLMDRHKDVVFVNVWENKWRDSMKTMELSSFIEYKHMPNAHWMKQMAALYMLNRMHQGRINTVPLVGTNTLRHILASTDIGLFPNRCEAGTNLALMEYMALGKPVIASYNSGHKDVLTDDNSFPMKRMTPFEVRREDDSTLCLWEEPDIEEIIEKLEWAYQKRDELKWYSKQTGESMKQFTWKKTAETVLKGVDLVGDQDASTSN